jgi:hypothetical protein
MLIFIIAAGIVLGLSLYNHPGSFGRALLFIVAVIAPHTAQAFWEQPHDSPDRHHRERSKRKTREKTLMSTSLKKKRKTVAAIFGVIDPEDSYTNFLFERRHLATVPERGGRELQYVVELDDLSHGITTTLDRIRERDGKKIFREVATYLREAIDSATERRHRARSKANGALPHTSDWKHDERCTKRSPII